MHQNKQMSLVLINNVNQELFVAMIYDNIHIIHNEHIYKTKLLSHIKLTALDRLKGFMNHTTTTKIDSHHGICSGTNFIGPILSLSFRVQENGCKFFSY